MSYMKQMKRQMFTAPSSGQMWKLMYLRMRRLPALSPFKVKDFVQKELKPQDCFLKPAGMKLLTQVSSLWHTDPVQQGTIQINFIFPCKSKLTSTNTQT